MVGTVTLKFGKRNRRTGKVRMSAYAMVAVDGSVKKVGAKAVSFNADEWAEARTIEFKEPVGAMTLSSEGGRFTLSNERYVMEGIAVEGKSGTERDVKVGGSLPEGTMRFKADFASLPALPGGYSFVQSSFPADATVSIKGVRKSGFGKAATRKVVVEYVIKGIDEAKPSKLKLTYSPKTGIFKGSFKVYASTGGDRPRRRRYTVKVVGFVVDGVGVGKASIRKPAAAWAVEIR